MSIEIVWNGWPHPEHEELIRKELAELNASYGDNADDLIFHLIEIGDLENGPLIEISGQDGKVYAEYIADPKWVTISGAQLHS